MQMCIYVKVNQHVSPLPSDSGVLKRKEITTLQKDLNLWTSYDHHDLTHTSDLTLKVFLSQSKRVAQSFISLENNKQQVKFHTNEKQN